MERPEGAAPRLLLIVHQFFPQFHSGTETLCERCARAYVAMGWEVDIVTSVITDRAALRPLMDSTVLDPRARALLSAPEVPLSRYLAYDHAPGIRVHAFTHSHDPRHGQPRFRREVTDAAVEGLVAELVARHRHARAIMFHQLHFPLRAMRILRRAGIPVSFVATDFFAVCPIGTQQYDNGRPCRGPGPGSMGCVRHLSDMRGWLKRLHDLTPAPIAWPWLVAYRLLGPWPRLPVHPWQNLYFLLERNRASRRFLRACDLILAPSARIERSLVAAGAPRRRLRRMPYGMPPPPRLARRARFSDPAVRLCFAGQITPRKGLHVLLDALDRLPAGGEWTLDVWGDFAHGGAYARDMRRRIAAMGPHVRMRGTFESYRVHEVLGSYDYVILPSTWAENLPLVLVSALQLGLPVIISDAEGLMDAFPDGRVHGRSFRMGDAGDLARVLADEIARRPAYDPAAAPAFPDVESFATALLGRSGRAGAGG